MSGGGNQPVMQPPYQPGPQTMGNSTMPAGGMMQNNIPNNTPNQNANLSSSFGRMNLQVSIVLIKYKFVNYIEANMYMYQLIQ